MNKVKVIKMNFLNIFFNKKAFWENEHCLHIRKETKPKMLLAREIKIKFEKWRQNTALPLKAIH